MSPVLPDEPERAFAEKPNCYVPFVEAIDPNSYGISSCACPEAPDAPFFFSTLPMNQGEVSPPIPRGGGSMEFWARIGACFEEGRFGAPAHTACQWRYQFTEVAKQRPAYTKAGSDAWATKDGGASGYAYNSIEDCNITGANFGSGDHKAGFTYPTTVAIRDENGLEIGKLAFGHVNPCPAGAIVKVEPLTFQDIDYVGDPPTPTTTEYWFQYENSIEICIICKSDHPSNYSTVTS